MAYKNPFLSRLSEGEEQRRYELSRQDKQTAANDRRYSEASDIFQKLPFTLNDMINEENDRKEKVRQFEVGKSQVDRAHGFQVRKHEDGLSASAKALEAKRDRELAKNYVEGRMLTPQGKAEPLPSMPVSRQPEIQAPAVPMDLKSLKESMSLHGNMQAPDVQSMSMSVRQSGPVGASGVRIPQGQLVGQTSGHAHIAETGLPKNETLLEQAQQGDYALAKQFFIDHPEVQGRLTVDDLAAEIARTRIMMDTTAHKQGMDHDKLELQRMQIASREQMAQMQMKLRERMAAQKSAKTPKEFAVTGEQNKQLLGAMNNLGAIQSLEDLLANNETGFLKGIEAKIRNFSKIVDPKDAEFQTKLQLLVNEEIKRLAGSAVSESEAGRVLSAMPDVFLDPASFRARLNAMKLQNQRMWDTTLTLSEFNSLNRDAQTAPAELKNRFKEKPTQAAPLSDDVKALLQAIKTEL